MLSIIEKEIQSLKEIQKCSRKVIEEAPEGNLRCAINKGCYQYYCGKKYLGNEKKEYIKQIAQKEYCLKLNRQIERYLQKLRELQELYENNSLEERLWKNLKTKNTRVNPLQRTISPHILR